MSPSFRISHIYIHRISIYSGGVAALNNFMLYMRLRYASP